MKLYRRENYLEKIRGFYHDTGMIKVITGMDTLTMEQERAMMNTLLQSVEIYPERQVEDGAWVRRITFKFPININGELYTDYVRKETTGSKDEDGESFLPKEKPDETVVLMSREKD